MPDALASAAVRGRILADETVPAGAPWSATMRSGECLRIVDLEGQQAVDFLVYDAADPRGRRYNAANTTKFAGNIHLTAGHELYDDQSEALMTIVADTCGRHDTLAGCCSASSNFKRYGRRDTPSCQANFHALLERHGLEPRDLVMNVNFFMNVPVGPDGAMAIVEGLSDPGDYVDLRAERDVLVLVSNCPQVDNPCNGYDPTPIRLIRFLPAED